MKKIIKCSNNSERTFRFYFEDGNRKLIGAFDIYEALSYVCTDLNIDAQDIYKIEEV